MSRNPLIPQVPQTWPGGFSIVQPPLRQRAEVNNRPHTFDSKFGAGEMSTKKSIIFVSENAGPETTSPFRDSPDSQTDLRVLLPRSSTTPSARARRRTIDGYLQPRCDCPCRR